MKSGGATGGMRTAGVRVRQRASRRRCRGQSPSPRVRVHVGCMGPQTGPCASRAKRFIESGGDGGLPTPAPPPPCPPRPTPKSSGSAVLCHRERLGHASAREAESLDLQNQEKRDRCGILAAAEGIRKHMAALADKDLQTLTLTLALLQDEGAQRWSPPPRQPSEHAPSLHLHVAQAPASNSEDCQCGHEERTL